MLHVSERTLQRYSKNNGSFAPINAERAMQLDKLFKRGKEVFGSIDKFYQWIKRGPGMLEGNLSLASLTTAEGIQMILTQLGRIEHGILA
jgi:putative toxin-antitoxin system antitoxin component (TIGR02293 family)